VTRWTTLPSPIGTLIAARDDVGLTALLLPGASAPAGAEHVPEGDPSFADVRTQLDEYFAGTRTVFDLPLHPTGSAFQLRVWEALCDIRYGETASYGEVATMLGKPGAFRAVGAANGRNPIAIIVPCHRVIGANGSLVGYGGGLAAKRWLLGHEGAHAGLFAV
jgi:methylated-DNA-[protein]-cysteine S-methyltransferase